MKSEKIVQFLSNKTLNDNFASIGFLKRKRNAAIEKIINGASVSQKGSSSVWLRENAQFLCQSIKELKFEKQSIRKGLLSLLEDAFLKGFIFDETEELIEFLSCYSEKMVLSEKELISLPSLYTLSLVFAISCCAKSELDKIPDLISAFHRISKINFHYIRLHFSPLERILRKDQMGIYSQMTRETQNLYRNRILSIGKKRKKSPEFIADELIKKATDENCHFGFFLHKKRFGNLYFLLILTLFSALSFVFFQFEKNVLFWGLSAVSLYFLSKRIIEFFLSRVISTDVLPAMRCDTVSEKEKTAVVITALISNEKDIDLLTDKLNQYCLNNKSQNDHLLFGLLCDLPQGENAFTKKDEDLALKLSSKIEKLNENEPCFFAVLRKRRFHKSENSYVGYERKRGAIEQFITFLVSGRKDGDMLFFGMNDFAETKYLITLDQDTELGILQAKRLIGRMIHPLNQPVIGKFHGRECVVSGHGIIQPRVSSSLLSKIKTPYGKIYSNGSGEIQYATASFDTMQTLFGEGNFCGKGIIDVNAFYRVVCGKLPEQKILSHDMPEGALLRAGLATDELFVDSDPQNAVSHYKRLHRWIRGDVQNLAILSFLPKIRVYFALENVFRYFVPVSQALCVIFSLLLRQRANTAVFIILFYHFLPLFETVLGCIMAGNFQIFSRHFKTKIRNLILNTFYQSFLSFSSIFHEAIYFSDAIIRSITRMLFTKKKLLEWQVYSPFSKGNHDLIFFLPSILLASISFFFVKFNIQFILLFFFLLYPFFMCFLSQKYHISNNISKKDSIFLKSVVKKEFSFFENMVNAASNFLPPDNIQFEPIEKIANRTSPTNIGLYLVSLVSAMDLGLIDELEMVKRAYKAFVSIEKMEHFEGHLFNWYDLSTLGVIGERFISTVDSGNFIASLIVLREALFEIKNNISLATELIEKIDMEIENVNFNLLFDRSRGLFFVGVFPDEIKRNTSYYDLYMSEARITAFTAIALGKIPVSGWKNLARPILSFSGRVGVGSWTGTCFEYFMPTLFFPIIENSLEDESLNFALFCQKRYSANSSFGLVFGISESGYNNVDELGNLQYYAFGTPYLAIYESGVSKKVISPYSSFLMLSKADRDLIKNLKRLEKLGATGPFGFYEALDFDSNFLDDFVIVKSYMSHHKGMSVIALANLLCGDKIVSRFMASPLFSAKTELLAERFPLEEKVLKRKKTQITRDSLMKPYFDFGIGNAVREHSSSYFTDGKISIYADENGRNRVLYDGFDLFDYEKKGLSIRICGADKEFLICPEFSENVKTRFGLNYVEYSFISDKVSIVFRIELIGGKNAFLVRLETFGIPKPYSAEICFDLILQKEKEYKAHPAFHNLSLEGSGEGNVLFLSRRKVDGSLDLKVFSSRKFKSKFFGFPYEGIFQKRMIYKPKVSLNFDVNESHSNVIPLIFSFDYEQNPIEVYLDGSFYLKKEIREISEMKMKRLDRLCMMDRKGYQVQEKLLSILNENRKFLRLEHKNSIKKEVLWKYGVSGDYPIISFVLERNQKNIKQLSLFLRAFKKMQIAGVFPFDFVIFHSSGDGYFDENRDALNLVISENKCEFLVGKHPGIHVVPYKNLDEVKGILYASKKILTEEYSNEIFTSENSFQVAAEEKFSEDESEKTVGTFLDRGYVIERQKFNPKVPFSHVVTDKNIGFVCDQNSLGFTWFRNAGLNRISKWVNVPSFDSGEKIYLNYNGILYDLILGAEKIQYLEHAVIYEGIIFGCQYSIFATVSSHLSGKIILVKLDQNISEGKIVFSFIPTLGKEPNRNVFVEERGETVLFSPSVFDEYPCGAYCFMGKKISFDFQKDRVFLSVPVREENFIVLGGYSGETHLKFLLKNLSEFDIRFVIEREQNANLPLSLEHLFSMEFWVLYQAVRCRFLARTGLYQSSGAFGFRDQLQDSLVFLDLEPKITKEHILRSASHQFLEGDVLHWWHTLSNGKRADSGIRSKCSDDYLWLLFACSEYITKTGDEKILDIKCPFLKSELLKQGEAERYIVPEVVSGESLREHLERAALLFMERGLGPHKLPDIGSGDWNDGMNQISGESVWLGFFGAICLHRCQNYFSNELREKSSQFLFELKKGLSASFNGMWFPRCFTEDGRILGSDVSLESECSIDLITQAFSAFYQLEFWGTENELQTDSVEKALLSASEILMKEKTRTIGLFTKPFSETIPSPGYIQRYCSGVRENGGQYTHAAVWFSMALVLFGEKIGSEKLLDLGKNAAKILDPSENNLKENFARYQREPYVLCGDVYEAAGFRGHGGWSWYTGAAGWYYKLLKILKEKEKKLP